MKLIKNILVGIAVVASASANAYDMPENLYLVGDATPSDWKQDSPVPMVKENDNTFTWEGNLYNTGSEQALKFLGQKDWGPVAIYAETQGKEITTDPNQEFKVVYGGDDNKWKVQTAGYYKLTLTLNPSNPESDAGTLTVNYLGESKPEIYMLGMVPNRWGDSSEGIAIYGSDGVYTWTGDIYYYGDDKQLKFSLTKGSWNAVTYLVPTEVNYNGNVLQIEPGTYPYQESSEDNGGLKDWFWGIKEGQSGQYKVSVNTNDKTITLELLKSYAFDKDNLTELYMLGLGAKSFDSNNPLPMTALGNGKFSWTGTLDYATTDGDENHANKQFKFVTPTGDWNKVYYLVPTGAEADGYIQAVEPGTYPVKMTTWTEGRNGVDAFFGLKPNDKGTYTITMDVPNMTFAISKDTSVGVAEIEAAEADAAEEIFDLNGRKVSREGIAAGVYIVRKAGTAKKVIIK